MGKNLIQQARGKGSPTYKAPSFRYKGKAKHPNLQAREGRVIDIIHCPGHSAPLAGVKYEDTLSLAIAPEQLKVGQTVLANTTAIENGNIVALQNIPEGTSIYNIESQPGDGGKFVRASGTFARIIGKQKDAVFIQLPSKKKKRFAPSCRATIGVVAGGGRTDKPFLKAGSRYYKMKARNKLYPLVSGGAMNAVDHPFGNKRSSRKGHATPAPRNAPPGRKVGMIAARRTGRKK